MSLPVDLELKKAFVELQSKMVQSSKKIVLIDSQIVALKRVKQHIEITEREISALPAATRTYESIGRMFILNDLETVKKNLQTKQQTVNTRAADLENTKQYLEKNIKESEDNIREMVQQRKQVEAKASE